MSIQAIAAKSVNQSNKIPIVTIAAENVNYKLLPIIRYLWRFTAILYIGASNN